MPNTPDAIMLFAAGFGTRMGALTRDTPKPLLTVRGRSLLDRTLDLARAIKPRIIVANTHYHADQFHAHLSDTDVVISEEAPDILETGGGLRRALPLLGDAPVFTSNTDAIWRGQNPFQMLRDAWRPQDMDALLLCVPLDNAMGHKGAGDFLVDDTGCAKRGPGVVYSGIQIIKTDGLAGIEQSAFSLNLLWDKMLTTNRLHCLTYPGHWCDVGTAKGLKLAEHMLETPNV